MILRVPLCTNRLHLRLWRLRRVWRTHLPRTFRPGRRWAKTKVTFAARSSLNENVVPIAGLCLPRRPCSRQRRWDWWSFEITGKLIVLRAVLPNKFVATAVTAFDPRANGTVARHVPSDPTATL